MLEGCCSFVTTHGYTLAIEMNWSLICSLAMIFENTKAFNLKMLWLNFN